MFARLSRLQGFTDTPQQQLNNNIAAYASIIPNTVVGTTQNNYSYPNTGYQSQQAQASNSELQGALASIGSVANVGISGRNATVPNLGGVLTGASDPLGANLAQCRTFQGLGGLSNMKAAQAAVPTGNACGWRYQAGTGPIAQVAQGAYGNANAPLDTAVPATDAVGNGVKYFWDLDSAEKEMVTDICKTATSCQDMSQIPVSAVGDFKNVCGYCTTSKKIIPISMAGGKPQPRYTDVDKQCASANIITVTNAAQCPAPPPGQPQPSYWKCFNSPLDRDCVALTAQFAGCSPSGTMAAALSAGTNPTDFADQLRQKKSFQVYQSLAQPVLSEDIIRQGNGTLFSAFMNFYTVNQNQYAAQNEKLAVSARDLCRQSGLYEQYNFCADLNDASRDIGLTCMQQEFQRQGGSPQGTSYPNTVSALNGMNWGAYKKSIETIVTNARSTEPTTQRNALNQLTGLGLQAVPTALSLGDGNQGCEVFWFDRLQGGVCMGRRAVLSATGSNIPYINVGGGEVDGTGLSEMVEFISFCDLRPSMKRSLMFGVVTDDGFQMAINQDVFNIKNQSMAFGAYYDQGPTWHQSGCFPIAADSQSVPNIVSFTWFESGGGATFTPYFYDCAGGQGWRIPAMNGNVDPDWQSMCYFTQEVAAPSLSFQVYQRGGVGQFCEKRLSKKMMVQPAAHAQFGKIMDQSMPADLMVMSISNELWKTTHGIAFSAFQAVTFCFNVSEQNVGGNGLNWMFLWGQTYGYIICCDNAANNSFNISLKTYGGRGQQNTSKMYNIPRDTWCIATINQVPATFGKSITGVQFFVQTCANLVKGTLVPSVGLSTFIPGGVLMDEYKKTKSSYGSMYIGGTNGQPTQLSMQVAWIHCFDNQLSTTDPAFWKKEVQGNWQGRWFE